ncbi:MAG: 50S ribosomal protein L37ae [Candidatus Marsarchaeota archaeon]|jgi:large subunit ribosomal protein L37Ae|nr:50S ribosomal protein L37ae [Candidatus Marsarchaeota archaeon]MCL5112647.1 50S ribosomal protein L37ae [Candidatus Marsarchaeota archaeon]
MANASIRYGRSIRKRNASVIAEKRAKYRCDVCGRLTVRRVGTSIWKCRHCNATYAGGAYMMKTPAGELAARLISDLAKQGR